MSDLEQVYVIFSDYEQFCSFRYKINQITSEHFVNSHNILNALNIQISHPSFDPGTAQALVYGNMGWSNLEILEGKENNND